MEDRRADHHYRFRAVLEEQRRERLLKGVTETPVSKGKGFLNVNDKWQKPYFTGVKSDELRYFLS